MENKNVKIKESELLKLYSKLSPEKRCDILSVAIDEMKRYNGRSKNDCILLSMGVKGYTDEEGLCEIGVHTLSKLTKASESPGVSGLNFLVDEKAAVAVGEELCEKLNLIWHWYSSYRGIKSNFPSVEFLGNGSFCFRWVDSYNDLEYSDESFFLHFTEEDVKKVVDAVKEEEAERQRKLREESEAAEEAKLKELAEKLGLSLEKIKENKDLLKIK